MLEDPQLQARGHFQTIEHPETGPAPHAQVAWRLSATPSPPQQAAPCFGQHNDYVLKDLLGMSDEEVAQLAEERVIAREQRKE